VTALEKRYRQSIESAQQAETYYEKLTDALDTADINQWKTEITNAEKERLENPAAMDIMAGRHISKIPELTEDTINKDYDEAATWIMSGFSIEEKQ
jgi:hypothetical protein